MIYDSWAVPHPFPNQVRLVLAEGLELSNLFYFWLSGTLERYLGDSATMEERELFRDNVFGISLSATGLSEVRLMVFYVALCYAVDMNGVSFLLEEPPRNQ